MISSHSHLLAVVDEDVSRLEVSMNDGFGMDVLDARQDLPEDRQGFFGVDYLRSPTKRKATGAKGQPMSK